MAKTYLEPFQLFFERLENAGELRDGVSAETAARYCLSTISPLFFWERQLCAKANDYRTN